jgi:hypothetical protein
MQQSDAERMRIKALTRWEGEGGALGRSGSRTDALDESELRILARIGYAALGEWEALPAESKEAMLGDVCRPLAQGDGARARTRIAEFLRLYGER